MTSLESAVVTRELTFPSLDQEILRQEDLPAGLSLSRCEDRETSVLVIDPRGGDEEMHVRVSFFNPSEDGEGRDPCGHYAFNTRRIFERNPGPFSVVFDNFTRAVVCELELANFDELPLDSEDASDHEELSAAEEVSLDSGSAISTGGPLKRFVRLYWPDKSAAFPVSIRIKEELSIEADRLAVDLSRLLKLD